MKNLKRIIMKRVIKTAKSNNLTETNKSSLTETKKSK